MTSPRYRILLVEEAPETQKIVAAALAPTCQVYLAPTLAQAEATLQDQDFDVIILDVILPDGSGLEFCARLRARERFVDQSIIFLTGESAVEQRVRGFEHGADDYITKPFELQEFTARVLAKARRRTLNAAATFVKDGFKIDLNFMRAYHVDGQSEVQIRLTPIEFKILVHFLKNPNEIFSREQLLSAVWGSTIHVSTHSVDTHISALRRKLGPPGRGFRAIVRQGYCYTPEEPSPLIAPQANANY